MVHRWQGAEKQQGKCYGTQRDSVMNRRQREHPGYHGWNSTREFKDLMTVLLCCFTMTHTKSSEWMSCLATTEKMFRVKHYTTGLEECLLRSAFPDSPWQF
ncbi:hypothetical protein RRG08_063888 [Elysia crispata]|uniref:Uncharacterized protein n=1 Tax=Elysia crispata TaxID=231223 RepID=A0AAE1EC01_9GAST|nr:hypothetical protein RRG08_063888 [Elysia crispata]